MNHIAKLFINGRSQAVRLPSAYRFEGKEVFIRQDPETGDVILSRKPSDWESFWDAIKDISVPSDFLDEIDRNQGKHERDPFEGWKE